MFINQTWIQDQVIQLLRSSDLIAGEQSSLPQCLRYLYLFLFYSLMVGAKFEQTFSLTTQEFLS